MAGSHYSGNLTYGSNVYGHHDEPVENHLARILLHSGSRMRVDVVDVDDEGVVQVRLQGACAGCPGAMMTLQFGVQRILQEEIQEVTKVVPVQ